MIYLLAIWVFVASLITGLLYWVDKRAAIKDRRRIPEQKLLVWSLLGGWPGGLLASRSLRHKTQKISYRVRFVICIIVNVAAMVAIGWFGWR